VEHSRPEGITALPLSREVFESSDGVRIDFSILGEIDRKDYQADYRMARQYQLTLHFLPCWNDVNSKRGQAQPFSASSLQLSGGKVVEQNLEMRTSHISHHRML
jgi:hypothetical protein